MKKLFSTETFGLNIVLLVLRIVIGIFLIIHGKEIFDAAKMEEYAKWDNFKSSSFMPYLGKGAEFVAGVLLVLGLFTRLTCLITIGTFAYIVFFVGNGKFWMEDQHPFMFVLFGALFFFTGPGAASLDGILLKKKNY
jgi:putative oxidoreductase